MISPRDMTTRTIEANMFLYGFERYKNMDAGELKQLAIYIMEYARRLENADN